MSLFQSFGQGDFWGKGFAFASPVNDLLDRGDFTLTELLDEDDLLQEIKSLNTRLIDFLAQESTLEEMVTYLVEPAPEGADDKRVHKYPYMACEVICCEVDHVLDVLMAMQEGAVVARLFSLLDTEGEVDDRLSGYFEKIVFVLLKRKCLQLMAYINAGGLPLFQKFVRHLSNYSVMQVVERFFLHQPGWEGGYATGPIGLDLGGGDDDGSGGSHGEPDLSLLRCQWSTMPEVVDLLVEQLAEEAAAGDEGVSRHAHEHTQVHVAELLLTVIENAAPDSPFVRHLTERMGRLAELAVPALDLAQPKETVEREALAVVREERSSMLSALTIVEALLSRPQAIKMQWDMGQQQHVVVLAQAQGGGGGGGQSPQQPQEQGQEQQQGEGGAPVAEEQDPTQVSLPPDNNELLEGGGGDGEPPSSQPGQQPGGEGGAGPVVGMEGMGVGMGMGMGMGIPTLGEEVLNKLVASLPLIRVYLETHERDDRTVATQTRQPAPKLGLTRLKLVRHVEALVKLCSAKVDKPLETEGVLKVCLDMFFKYEWTSVLHQSITRIVTWIMDAGPSRLGLQLYLVREGAILERILAANAYNDEEERVARVPTAAAGMAPPEVLVAEDQEEDQAAKAATAVGEGEGGPVGVRCRRGYMGHLFIMAQAIMEAARQPTGPEQLASMMEQSGHGGETEGAGAEAAEGPGQGPGQGQGPNGLRASLAFFLETEVDPELLSRWAAFIQGRLAQVTATQCQPLGGYPIPSRADENKLSTKFDEEEPNGTDFDTMSDMLAQRLQGVDVTGKDTSPPGTNGMAFAAGGEGLTAEEAVRIAASVPLAGVGVEGKGMMGAGTARAQQGEGEGEDDDDFDIRSAGGVGGDGWALKFGAEGAPTTGTFGEGFVDPMLLEQQQQQAGGGGGEWADFSAFTTGAAGAVTTATAADAVAGAGEAAGPSSSSSSSSSSFLASSEQPPSASTSSGSLMSTAEATGLEFEADFSDLPPMQPPSHEAPPPVVSAFPVGAGVGEERASSEAAVAGPGGEGFQVPNGGGIVAEYFAGREAATATAADEEKDGGAAGVAAGRKGGQEEPGEGGEEKEA